MYFLFPVHLSLQVARAQRTPSFTSPLSSWAKRGLEVLLGKSGALSLQADSSKDTVDASLYVDHLKHS